MPNPKTIHLSVKMLGKRRAVIEKQLLEIPISFYENPHLKQFISLIVTQQVNSFNKKTEQKLLLPYLSSSAIQEQAEHGKVTFGDLYNKEKVVEEEAIQTALQAFEDGIFLVIIDGQRMETLADEINFQEDSEVVFIRLVALAGGIF